MAPKKTLEETFKKMDQKEHILELPGMYIGDTNTHLEELWVFNERMIKKIINYSPGLLKIFDEIITNSTDAAARDSTVSMIKVNINQESGEITVYNNGNGIPIELHKEHGIYIPELVFGNLLAGSNFDKNEKKTGSGVHGLGSTLTNIFSSKFIVETVDSNVGKKYIQEYNNNMSIKSSPKITKSSTKSYTRITFIPDFARFKMTRLESDTVLLFNKRVVDCIASTNASVSVYLNDVKLKSKGLLDYCKYYFPDASIIHESQTVNNLSWEYCVIPSDEFKHVSFVNGNMTSTGGTHVNYIVNQITSKIIKSKKKFENIKPLLIKNKLFVFLSATIYNPSFLGQTKESLITPIGDFGCKIEVSDAFINKIVKTSITSEILEMQELKQVAALAKTTDGTKKNKLYNIPKLNDALLAGTRRSKDCTLILTEGDSAMTFALHGRSILGIDKYGVFPLKGNALNPRSATNEQLINNKEINNIKQILGLKQGVEYTRKSIDSDLRYGKVMLLTDQDSVTGDTPLLLKNKTTNQVEIQTIERISFDFKSHQNKEYGTANYEIWTEEGWTNIKTVVRHKVDKKIFRVLTHTGAVDITEDHSLLNIHCEKICPKDCNIGDSLLHSYPNFNDDNTRTDLENLNIKELRNIAKIFKIRFYQNYKKIELIKIIKEKQNSPKIEIDINNDNISLDEAWVMGFWWADGTAGHYEFQTEYKSSNRPNSYTCNRSSYNWSICNNDYDLLVEAKRIMDILYSNYDFKIIQCNRNNDKKNNYYKLIVNQSIRIKPLVDKYIDMFYYRNEHTRKYGNKYIPHVILNSHKQTRTKFLNGYYCGDGLGHDITNSIRELTFDIEGKIGTSGMYYICKSLGYEVSINHNPKKPKVYTLIITKGTLQKDPTIIKKIIDLGVTTQYVYDIETDNHHFHAGVGSNIVHNTDGLHVSALVINIFHFWWPSLLKNNYLQTLRTPLIKANNGNDKGKTLEFFTEQDYDLWKENGNNKGYNIKYYKGLGSSTKLEAQDIFKKFSKLKIDYTHSGTACDTAIQLAFNKDKETSTTEKSSDQRKEWLKAYNRNNYINATDTVIKYADAINKGLVHFSMSDNNRSIPHLCDGLKPSQRKVMHYMLKHSSIKDIKVGQLSGYISAETHYHHGDSSLQDTIVKMAQTFVGSNNVNLLQPLGNFGSRVSMGKDSAAPRYISTALSPLAKNIFNNNDLQLLKYLSDDGHVIEPEFFIPIIPMILVNGGDGIGTGFSTHIPQYNPIDLIDYIINDKQGSLVPYYKGFNGIIEKYGNDSYKSRGVWSRTSPTEVTITELPIGVGILKFKEDMESLVDIPKTDIKKKKKTIVLKDVTNKTIDDETGIEFVLEFKSKEELDLLINSERLEVELKLCNTINTSNMYLFTSDSHVPIKFNTVHDIINEYYNIRLKFYDERRVHMIKELTIQVSLFAEKIRFINEYISGEIVLHKQSLENIKATLIKRKFKEYMGDYNYLLHMPIINLTSEKLKDFQNNLDKKQDELNYIQSKTSLELWIIELKNLRANLIQVL